jgi:peptide chain release factor 3
MDTGFVVSPPCLKSRPISYSSCRNGNSKLSRFSHRKDHLGLRLKYRGTCCSCNYKMVATDAPDASSTTSPATDEATLRFEVSRRRNLAIISHPDAGKSTLTEKLLLYGGAIQQAGSVRARRSERSVASDWMKIEQERGISITSAVLTFEYAERRISLVDTPGHADFGEDTYRTLSAVDNAVMLVDAAKGLEPQTRKLFEVCRMRNLPTFTFVNKLDRPAMNAFQICDQIEAEFGLDCYPVVWPIGDGDRFKGVYERSTRLLHLFSRAERGKKAEDLPTVSIDDDSVAGLLGTELYDQLMEDVEILETMGHEYDEERVMAGELSPMFFGSAMNNFGVELFLQRFLELSRSPPCRESSVGEIDPTRPQFTGQVFKLQANMDPKHRDRLAFVRVFSGVFEKGMKVGHSRLPGKSIALTRPQTLFAADRYSVETAYAGDVVGLNNPGVFAIGDTVFEEGAERMSYPGIPSFSPELFAYMKNPNPSSYKNFRKGLQQLLEEGAVQMLRAREDQGNEDPILAAVGQLQFEVVQRRLKDEYNVDSKLEPLGYSVARWVTGPGEPWEALDSCGRMFNVFLAKDRWERPVVLFKNEWNMNSIMQDNPNLELAPWAFAPVQVSS